MKKAISLLCAVAMMLSCLCVSAFADAPAAANHITDIIELTGTTTVGGDVVDAKFFCTNVTEEGIGDAASVLAEYVINRESGDADGSVRIYEAYKSITLGDITVTSADINGGKEGDYVIGVLFVNVDGDDDIEVTFDGIGKDPTNDTTVAPVGQGVGNTTLRGIEIKDQNGDGVIHIGCIGDSITAGNPGKCYPDYLQEYLNELSKIDGNTYVVHNNGKGGAGVGHKLEQVGDPNWGWGTVVDEDEDGWAYFYYDDQAYRNAFTYVHDVTIVQMGTNDWGASNRDEYFAEDYYNYLVKPFQDMGSQVIVSTPPYAYEDMFSVINTAVHEDVVEMAWDLDLPIVDMNRLTYGMDEIYDGIHPFPAGYSVMALLFYEYIFGGEPTTVNITSEPGTQITFVDGQGRSFNRDVPASGEVTMVLSPAETTYNLFAECDGYLTYKKEITLSAGVHDLEIELVAGENVSYSGTTFACDSAVYKGDFPHDHNCINDGDMGTGYQPNSYKSGDYVGVEFDESNVSLINIYWETATYISSFDKNGFELWFKVNGEWVQKTTADVAVTRESYTGDIVCDVVSVDPAEAIEGVKIVILDGEITDHKFAPKLYELEVFAG